LLDTTGSKDRAVVILGEYHFKDEEASNVGIKIVDKFRFVGVEGQPPREYEAYPFYYRKILWIARKFYSLNFSHPSTVQIASYSGLTIQEDLGLMYRGYPLVNHFERAPDIKPGSYCTTLFSKDAFVKALVRIEEPEIQSLFDSACILPNDGTNPKPIPLNDLLSNDLIVRLFKDDAAQNNLERLIFWLESGEFLTPTFEKEYLVDQRNERMATNIVSLLKQIPDEHFLIINGKDHNDGLKYLLQSQLLLPQCSTGSSDAEPPQKSE